MVPYWDTEGEGVESRFTDDSVKRAIAMALVDSELWEGDEVEVEIRGREDAGDWLCPTSCAVKPHPMRARFPT